MRAVAVDSSGTTECRTLEEVRRRLHAEPFVWIDLEDDELPEGDLAAQLGLAPHLGWLGRSDRPARVDVRDRHAQIVVPFATGTAVADVHAVAMVSPLFLLTVHKAPVPALDELRAGAGPRMGTQGHVALYLFLDAAAASFKRVLVGLGRDLEELQDDVATLPARDQLLGLAALRRRLVALRRTIGPYADALDAFVAELPSRDDVPEEGQRLVHALNAHMASLSRDLASFQETTAHELETYATLVSMRQSQVINRLTIVSTVVLPLTFLTGFFGMNFPYLVAAIEGPLAFWLLGVALQIGVVTSILIYIRHRGWLRLFEETEVSRDH